MIIVIFWIIKVLTTGVGEVILDWFAVCSILFVGAVGLVGFVVVMWWQFRVTSYQLVIYWFVVLMVVVFGIMVVDGFYKVIGVFYIGTIVMYAIVFMVIFVLWY